MILYCPIELRVLRNTAYVSPNIVTRDVRAPIRARPTHPLSENRPFCNTKSPDTENRLLLEHPTSQQQTAKMGRVRTKVSIENLSKRQ